MRAGEGGRPAITLLALNALVPNQSPLPHLSPNPAASAAYSLRCPAMDTAACTAVCLQCPPGVRKPLLALVVL